MVTIFNYTPYAPDVGKSASGPAIAGSMRQNALLKMKQKQFAADGKTAGQDQQWKEEDRAYLEASRKFKTSQNEAERWKQFGTMVDEVSNVINPDNHDQIIGVMSAQVGFDLGVPPIDKIMEEAAVAGATTPEQQNEYYNTVAKEKYLVSFQTKRKERMAAEKEQRKYDKELKLKTTEAAGGAVELTKEEIDHVAAKYNIDGRMPPLGRGKKALELRSKIIKSAAVQAMGEGGDTTKSPIDAALDVVATQADTKAMASSIRKIDNQLSSMGSFVTNLNSQIDRVKELSEDLKTFDTRLLNKPLRYVRGRIKGSPEQAKYDMFLTEIESEIGKLATGSTGSVAELSATAQEKWEKIHDKNLSVTDMLSLLEETKEAANLRVSSVKDELGKTRERMRTRDYKDGTPEAKPEEIQEITTKEAHSKLPSGTIYTQNGVQFRKK